MLRKKIVIEFIDRSDILCEVTVKLRKGLVRPQLEFVKAIGKTVEKELREQNCEVISTCYVNY